MENFLPPSERCPVCEQAGPRHSLDVFYWREHRVQFAECPHCHLTFANPMPSDALISQGNSALVRLYLHGKSFDQEFREARQAYLRGKLLARRLRRWKKKGRFLELGAYQGFFSLGVKDNCDWEVETLEIAQPLVEFIRGKLGIRCISGTLENAEIPPDSYDFVACYDLIEHINRPREFLHALHRILKPGGRVEILTPNTLQDFAFNRRAYAKGTPITMLLNHIMNFSPRSLELALEKTDMHIVKWHCYSIRHAAKDFGWFGLGQPGEIPPGPSMEENLALPAATFYEQWTPEKILELKCHPKVSRQYGFWKETLPAALAVKLPARWGIGHEIYALAEKRG